MSEVTNYSIFSRSQYFGELVYKINGAKSGDRVALATMNLEPWDTGVSKILNSLNKAAARGVNTLLIIDAYSFMAGDNMFTPGPLFWRKSLPKHLGKQHRKKLNALEEFKQAGGRYRVVNQPVRLFTPPFKGRSHIKFAVINDNLFTGNCNLDKTDQIDLMLGWNDPKAADKLYNLAEKIIKTGYILKSLGSNGGQELKLSPDSQLLIDAGKPGQSIIFDRALQIIDSAQKSVVFACQYFPDKKVLNHLVAAHKRGVDVKLIYNHPLNRAPVIAAAHYLNKTKSRLTMPSFLFKNQLPRKSIYMHAKLLASEQAVMIGSHNYVEAGVKFGTAEMTLYVENNQFSKDCVSFLVKQL